MKSWLFNLAYVTKTLILAAVLIAMPLSGVASATQPFFKARGGDVFAGGWFKNLSTCSTAHFYQAPVYDSSAKTWSQNNDGGIQTWLKSGQGSATDLAAFALGDIQIDHTGAQNYGFSAKNSFSNTNKIDSNSAGGDFEGTVPQSHCIPDYYGTLQKSPTAFNGNLTTLANSGQYTYTCDASCPLAAAPSPVTIGVGKNIAVFIKGNIYINSDIKYAGGYTESNSPKFVLVVKGSIYISPNVHQMDGWYVAQPDTTDPAPDQDDTGNIWTCHESTTNLEDAGWVAANCGSQLVINGALTAKEIDLLRINGDVATPGSTPAEVVNFTPEMVVGSPFFSGSSSATPVIQSITSLPPIL